MSMRENQINFSFILKNNGPIKTLKEKKQKHENEMSIHEEIVNELFQFSSDLF